MAKNPNDKYYTQPSEVKKVMEIVRKYIPLEEITEIIEPAAGDGAFIEEIKKLAEELNVPYKFYDLYPDHPEIEEKDFKVLEKELEYKKGRLWIGNPPFGNASSLFIRFRNAGVRLGDWAVYIGPASHYNLKYGLDKKGLELVYSEHLGGVEYRGLENKKVNTCINVYKKFEGKKSNIEEQFDKDWIIYGRVPRAMKVDADFYLRCIASGARKHCGQYDPERKFAVSTAIKCNREEWKEKAEKFFKNFENRFDRELRESVSGKIFLNIKFLKQKMIEEFYPTREEMLERDFEINSILRRYGRWGRMGKGKEPEIKYDFFIDCCFKPGLYLENIDLIEGGSFIGIKIKNEKFKNSSFFKNIKLKYDLELGKGFPGFTIPWLKQKMIEEFYTEKTPEQRLEDDNYGTKTNK